MLQVELVVALVVVVVLLVMVDGSVCGDFIPNIPVTRDTREVFLSRSGSCIHISSMFPVLFCKSVTQVISYLFFNLRNSCHQRE